MSTFVQLYGILLDREVGSTDTQLFTTQRRKDAVNEAQREFVRLTECLTRDVTDTPLPDTTSGPLERDLDSVGVISAADFLMLAPQGIALKKVSGSVTTYITGDDLPRRDVVWLDRYNAGWRTATPGTPTAYYIREDGGQVFLGFTPAIDVTGSDVWSAIIPYICLPTDMSADADEPFTVNSNAKRTLRQWHQGLVHFAAARMEELRKNYQGVDRQLKLFNSYIQDYLQHQRRPGGTHVVMARDYLGDARSRKVPGTSSDWFLR
jgi:hypothetical protein